MDTQSKDTAKNAQTHCTRCGTCCCRGGPALHEDDLDLVVQKKIAPENLYTIRKGELVYDNVNGGLMKTAAEIIKIKSAEGSGACIYYDREQSACSIYEIRPVECRVMECWNTAAAEAFYALDRIDRNSVFGNVDWIMDLIRTHEEKCGYEAIGELVENRRRRQPGAADKISEALRYDAEMRRVLKEKTGLNAEFMDLVFGRPLEKTISVQFGVKLEGGRNG
ncbi:MAG: YkgJ family cysteine cluster protein [Desulfosalsimonas sp.]